MDFFGVFKGAQYCFMMIILFIAVIWKKRVSLSHTKHARTHTHTLSLRVRWNAGHLKGQERRKH